MTTKSMTAKALHWYNQEFHMVRKRVLLRLGRAGIYTGNPMTARQGIAHLHSVKSWIKSNPDLY